MDVILGEVSALYDVLVVSADTLVAAETAVPMVACVEMDDAVSFLNGGELGCGGGRAAAAAAAAATTATAPDASA